MFNQDEINRIQSAEAMFNGVKITRDLLKALLGRDISDAEWNNYIKPQPSYQPESLSSLALKSLQSPMRSISKQASHAARKRLVKLGHMPETERTYQIVKITEQNTLDGKITGTKWKIVGEVDLFQLRDALLLLLDTIIGGRSPNTLMRIYFRSTRTNKQGSTTSGVKDGLLADLFNKLDQFMEYEDFNIEEILFTVVKFEEPTGAGSRVNKIISIKDKKSIIDVKNTDNLCLSRSIVTGLLVKNVNTFLSTFKGKLLQEDIDKINHKRQTKTKINEGIISDNEKKYIKVGQKLQEVLAKALHRLANVPLDKPAYGIEDVKIFENCLKLRIAVYNMEARSIYNGNSAYSENIHILLDTDHFHFYVITKLDAFLAKDKYHNAARDKKCKGCGGETKCPSEGKEYICTICNKIFYNMMCYDKHFANNFCITHSYKCKQCNKYFKTKQLTIENHKCNEIFCKNCEAYKEIDHACYMKKVELKPPTEKYMFFDFEAKKDPVTNQHIVNYVVAHDFQGNKYTGYNIDQFCNWAFSKQLHKGYTFIAHYGKGYDFQFIVAWLVEHGVKPNIIQNGEKIMVVEVKHDYNIRFVDSLSFISLPLREFPKTFGLDELAKGYFPHYFNTDENQNYIGSYPDKSYYGYSELGRAEKIKFDSWYESVKNTEFNFMVEMDKYCNSDVDILRKGCLKFRENFITQYNTDPFQYITFPSLVNAIYRSVFMPENTIVLVDENQYDTYSIKSIKWMKYLSNKFNINIKHACNGGEIKIMIQGKQYKVDGFCSETRSIYQFHGCFFHGCPDCYKDPATINKLNHYRMGDLYQRTLKYNELIKAQGFNLVTIWEHEFDVDKLMKNTSLDEYDLIEPPKLRDAYFGGRTEAFKLIYNFMNINPQIKGKYIDVCSLYPWVMYYCKFPIHKPVIISKPNYYDKNWFGLVYCKVLAPRGLYLPVLPYKQKTKQAHKLLFGLCRSCMGKVNEKCTHFKTNQDNIRCSISCTVKKCEACKAERKRVKENCKDCYNYRNEDCNHTDRDRAFTGFWTTVELEEAIKVGYKIEEIYEVHQFKETSSELFKDYIKSFLKIKLETSKFNCTEEEYRKEALDNYGIQLKDKLEYNSGLRYSSKLAMNALYGKFGQNSKQTHKEYIDNFPEVCNKVIYNDKIDPNWTINIVTDKMVYVTYEDKNEFIKTSYNTNIYIAIFTTAHARIKLLKMMQKLGRNVLYCDTDSVFYNNSEETNGLIKSELGDVLGLWTDELEGKSIDYWCCAQAKDYGYIDNDGKCTGKVKGFRKNAETEEKMTFDSKTKLTMQSIDYYTGETNVIPEKVNINYKSVCAEK